MSGPQPPRCALGRVIVNPMDTEEVKRDGFVQHGILVVAVDDPRLNWMEQKVVENLGRKLYGDRASNRR